MAQAIKYGISWDDAQMFLLKLNEGLQSGTFRLVSVSTPWMARLPTEAEWEYAARCGMYDGLENILGACWQWCEDWYGPYRHGLEIDPEGPREGVDRVMRGTPADADRRFLRLTARGHRPPATRAANIGFRIVLIKE